jgi:transposase
LTLIENSNVTIGHLGIVAGIIDQLAIPEYIDKTIPKLRHHSVTHGITLKGLLLNGLGYNERRLYLMPEYFEDIATERLLGKDIKPEHLNQYLFGETLDAISAYGPTRLFTGIVLQMMEQLKMGTVRLHYDTTSINVTGEYDSTFNTRLIQIVHGHSKDHRSDLKQFIINLATNQNGIPLFMEPLSGNESDKKTLLRTIETVRKNLVTDETVYHMADSAFYSAASIATLGKQCFWITRVPETITETRSIIQSCPDWTESTDPRYKYAVFKSEYGGIPQQWVLFQSSEQHNHKAKKFQDKVDDKLSKDQTALRKLCVKGFACETDARLTVERWLAKHPRYLLDEFIISVEHRRKSGLKGRPKKDEELIPVYFVSCSLGLNLAELSREQDLLGRFILGTNDLTLDPDQILKYYKEQSTVERGFKFIKDQTFHASDVYLENENRIAALVMIMVLCLLVYSLTEWLFRNTLREKQITIRNQVGKPTQKPRAKWVYFLFRRVRQIDELTDGKRITKILNINEEIIGISRLLGPNVEKYYS